MPRYSVRCENIEVGQVEAADTNAALDLAYGLREWSPREAMSLMTLPEGAGPPMHILIDTTNGRALARHESYRALAALHYIQFANVDAVILRCGTNRVYAALTQEQLDSVLRYAGFTDLPADYQQRIKMIRTLEDAPWLLLPFDTKDLDAQAFNIDPQDARPMAYNPQDERPVLVKTWSAEPQVNRKRVDSAFWVNFAAGNPSGHSANAPLPHTGSTATVPKRNSPPTPNQEDTSVMATKAPAKKAAKKTAPAKKAAKKTTSAAPAKKAAKPAAPVDEKNGVRRPKPGGNTAQVWDACDALMAKKKSAPAFKEVDEYIEKKNADIPTATRRSNYAAWRKYNGITGRIAE